MYRLENSHAFPQVSKNVTGAGGNVMTPVLRFAFVADSKKNVDLSELNVIGGLRLYRYHSMNQHSTTKTVGVGKFIETTMIPLERKRPGVEGQMYSPGLEDSWIGNLLHLTWQGSLY